MPSIWSFWAASSPLILRSPASCESVSARSARASRRRSSRRSPSARRSREGWCWCRSGVGQVDDAALAADRLDQLPGLHIGGVEGIGREQKATSLGSCVQPPVPPTECQRLQSVIVELMPTGSPGKCRNPCSPGSPGYRAAPAAARASSRSAPCSRRRRCRSPSWHRRRPAPTARNRDAARPARRRSYSPKPAASDAGEAQAAAAAIQPKMAMMLHDLSSPKMLRHGDGASYPACYATCISHAISK